MNKCEPYQIKLNNTCLNCTVPNCLLCSLYNERECDVCAIGYILDTLTRSQCVQAVDTVPVCNSTTCACPVFQVNDNGVCKNCNVSNCLLCSVGKLNECDVCKTGYVLDALTKSSCVSLNNNPLVCNSMTCHCSPYQSYVNGACQNCSVLGCLLCSATNNH